MQPRPSLQALTAMLSPLLVTVFLIYYFFSRSTSPHLGNINVFDKLLCCPPHTGDGTHVLQGAQMGISMQGGSTLKELELERKLAAQPRVEEDRSENTSGVHTP